MKGLIANYQFENENPTITFNKSAGIVQDSLNRFYRGSGTAWGEQIYSSECYTDNAYVSWRVVNPGTSCDYMIGLNTDPTTNASYNTIDFAWYMYYGAIGYSIYENSGGPVYTSSIIPVTGDLLAISYWDGIVTYWLNGVAKRSVNVGMGKTFYLDGSFGNIGTTYLAYDIYFGRFAPDFHVQTFYGNDTFYPPLGVTSVIALIVAGGGGGGMDMGGGGGAGGILWAVDVPVLPGTSYPIVVGNGGYGAPSANIDLQPNTHQFTVSAGNGGNSTFAGYTAIGGGYGASSVHTYLPNYGNAGAGGSGGGSSGYNGNYDGGGAGTAGQGYNGGNSGTSHYSGGGGGKGGAGTAGDATAHGGDGAIYTSISAFYFGGGGGGAGFSIGGGNGGKGGGGGAGCWNAGGPGTGGIGLNNGENGVNANGAYLVTTIGGKGGTNTGGGGGGGPHYQNGGGTGGSGIVMIRYKRPIFDAVGINHGVSYNSPYFTKGPKGKRAISLNGTQSAVVGSFNRVAGQELSVSCWFNQATRSGYQNLVSNRDLAAANWMLYTHTTDGSIQLHGIVQYKSTIIPTLNVWHHVVVTVNSSGVSTLYLDGVVVITNNSYVYFPSAPTTMCIGATATEYEFFNGMIADVRIYNRAINAKEVSSLIECNNTFIETDGTVDTRTLIES